MESAFSITTTVKDLFENLTLDNHERFLKDLELGLKTYFLTCESAGEKLPVKTFSWTDDGVAKGTAQIKSENKTLEITCKPNE